MDNKLVIQLQDHAMMVIMCEPGVRNELREYFSFFVPGYKFMPAYRNRVWDGKIRLYNSLTCEINVGLYAKVLQFAKDRGYLVEVKRSPYGVPGNTEKVNHPALVKFFNNIGLPFEPRDYQYDAVVHAIEKKRAVLISPTGSGKSLIIYLLLRWYLENHGDKILVIVPTTSLVEQMFKDFKDYGYESDDHCHVIYSGKDKQTDKRVVISTWQSIHRLAPTWFEQFGCIFGDECHGFKAKSLSSIMNKAGNAEYRVGTTGTLDGTQTHKLVLEGLFGPVKKVTTTKELQDNNTLAPLDIEVLLLQYPESIRKEFGQKTYMQEMDFICRHEKRNLFIKNLATGLEGNTLVLFQYVEKHGKVLAKLISDEAKNVYYVHGKTDTADRENVRKIVEKKKNAIIVASMGTFSTGINIKNLHNIVFASPSKAQIRVLQSIGRGLRQSEDGRTTKLFDLTDDLHWKEHKNYTLLHSFERIKIYDAEQFTYNIHKVNL